MDSATREAFARSHKRYIEEQEKKKKEEYRQRQIREQFHQAHERYKIESEQRYYDSLSPEGKAYYTSRKKQEYYDSEAKKAQEARDDYANSGEYVTFREQLKPNNGLGFRDWYNSKKKMNELNTQAEEAQNTASAYRSMTKKQELSKLPSSEIEKEIDRLEEEIEPMMTAKEKLGRSVNIPVNLFNSIFDTNIDAPYNSKAMELDREAASYRQVYSDVKSEEEISKLPDDVVKLLDEYNSIGYEQEALDWGSVANAFAGQTGGGGNTVRAASENRKSQIAKSLEEMGYSNYEELAKYRKYQTDKQMTQEDAEAFRKFAEEHPVVSSAYTVAAAPAASVMGMVGNVKQADDRNDNFKADQYDANYSLSRGNSEIRGTVASGFENGLVSNKTKRFIYNTVMSGADSVVASRLPGGELILGASVMNDTIIEMNDKGASTSQALKSGLMAGTFESFFEHFSIGKMKHMREVPATSFKDWAKNVAKSTVTNLSEEAATEIADITYDYIANGGISDYAMSVEEKMQSGMSEADARKAAAKEMGIRVGEAGLSGALMGGVFGTAGSAIGKANYDSAMLQEGKAITQNGEVETLLAGGYDLRTKEDSDYNKLYSAVQSEEESRNKIINNQDTEEAAQPQKYSRKQLKTIGQLSQALFERGNSEAKDIQVKAIEQRLRELDTEDAGAKAQVLFDMMNGERVSRKDKNILKGKNGKVEQKYLDVVKEWNNQSDWALSAKNSALDFIERVYNPDIEKYRNRNAQTNNADSVTEEAGQALATDIDSVIRQNADKYTKGGAAAAKEMYRQGQDARIYENSFSAFYEAGRKGTSFDIIKSQDVLSNDFDERQAQKAYEMGVEAGKIGRQTKITGIAEITDGDIIVKDTDGNEVSLGNIEVDSATARTFRTAAAYGDVETANTFIRNYYPGTNFDTYRTGFEMFYTEGVNSKQSFENFIKDGSYDETLKGFSKETAKLAYDAGRKVAAKVNAVSAQQEKKASSDTKVTKAKGEFTDETLNDSELAPVYEALSRKIGVDIKRVPSIVSSDGKTANAQFIPQMFRIVISENADSEFTDTMHELTHLTAKYAGKKYKNVSDAVLAYAKQKSTVNYEKRIAQLMIDYNTNDRAYVEEEFVAEQIAGIFSTEDGVNDFINWLQTESGYSEKEKKTILQRIADILKDIIDAIKETIRTGELSPIAKDAAQMQADKASEIRQMFLDALDEAAENYKKGQASQEKVRNSIKKTQNMQYDEQIEKIFSNQFSRSDSLYIGIPSENLINAGFSNAPFAMNQSDIRKSYEVTAKNKNYSRHGVPKEFFEKLPVRLNNAVMFIKNKNGTTVITDYLMNDRGGKESYVVAGVWHDRSMENDVVNQVKSVYPLDNFENVVLFAAENNNLVVMDKTKAQAMLATVGVQPSEVSKLLELSKNSLSQTEDNVKYSLKLSDTDSMGNQLSDEQREFFKDSKVLDEEGNLLVVYHGTDADFTVFDKTKGRSTMDIQGMFFSPWEIDAKGYGGNVRAYYLNITNPASDSTAYKALNRFKGQNNAGVKAREYLESLGYDGVNNYNEEYIAFYPEQIKLVDNVNPTADPDIRYSLKQKADDALRRSLGMEELQRENLNLLRQNREYERYCSELENRMIHPDTKFTVDYGKCEALSTRFRRDYRSSIDKGQLSGALASFYNWIAAQGEKLKGDAATTRARQVAVSIIEKSKNMQKEISPEAKEILKEIRSTGVTLNEGQRQEAANQFGSYNNFRKAAMGSIKIMNNATPLDVRWSELAEAYPQWFDKDISDADQAVRLFEIVGSLRNTYSDDSGFDFDSAVDFLTTEILNGYYEVPKSHLLSNEYRAKLEKERQKNRAEINKIKADYKAKFEESRKQVVAALQSNTTNIDEIKGGKDSIVNTQVAANIARLNMRAQRADKSLALRRIERRVKRMNNLLLKSGTKRSTIYDKDGKQTVVVNTIPEKYRNLIAQACAAFTDNTENGAGVFDTSKLSELYAEYSKIKKESEQDYDPDILEKIDELKTILKDRRLNQLSQDELQNITDILDHFMNLVRNETELFVSGQQVRLDGVGNSVLSYLDSKGIKKIRMFKDKDIGKSGRQFFTRELKPVYFFERVGGPFQELYQEIRNGQDTYVRDLEPAKAFLQNTVKKYNASKWLKENASEKYTTTWGETIELTLQQKMLIYATAKREMTSGQDSLHLMDGGVVFENQIEKGNGKGKIWKYKENDSNAHRIAFEDIKSISDSLTDEQKQFTDALVGYLSNEMAALGNEVSMKLYGYRKFTEKYYIPFNSADSFGRQRFGESGETLLRALGFTKATKHGAKTPLVLSDFLDVWGKHVERMSAYHSLVIPLDNFARVWNYTTPTTGDKANASVEAMFKSAFGNEYRDYVVEFIKDVNGNVMSDRREESFSKWVSLYKKNAVLASASVVIQQPSAIARALALVDARYFMKTTFSSRKKAYEELKKYAPVAVMKEIGGFDTVSGRNAVDWLLEEEKEGKWNKLASFFTDSQYRDDVLTWGPEFADRITWSHLWLAVKAETKAKTGLSGEALLEAAGKRFGEVVDRTQVYDSVMSRSSFMRSKSTFMAMATSFMSEPTVSANMLMHASWQAKKGYKKAASRTIGAVVAATLFNAMLKSIVTAGRDDDEDETMLEKYLAQIVSNFTQDLNPLSLLPFFRDIASLLQGYDVTRSDMTPIGDLINSIKTLGSDTKTVSAKIQDILGSVAGLGGIPLRNVLRDFNGLSNSVRTVGKYGDKQISAGGVKNAVDDEILQVFRNMNVEAAKQDSRDEKMYQYWANGDSEMYNRTAEQYKTGSQVRSAIINGIKVAFKDGDITQAEAESQLQRLGFDDNEVYYQIREWKEPIEGDKTDKNDGYFKYDTATDPEEETDDEEEEDAYAKYDFLNAAVKSGSPGKIQDEVDDLLEHGIEQEKIDTHIRSALRKYDTDVQEAAAEYKNGNFSAFDSAVSSVASKYQISESVAAGAIRAEAGVKYRSIDNTYYAMADVNTALENDDTQTARKITYEILRVKYYANIEDGDNPKDALSNAKASIKSSMRAKWKDKYKEADYTERVRIRSLLWSTGAYSNMRQLNNTLNGWLREK